MKFESQTVLRDYQRVILTASKQFAGKLVGGLANNTLGVGEYAQFAAFCTRGGPRDTYLLPVYEALASSMFLIANPGMADQEIEELRTRVREELLK